MLFFQRIFNFEKEQVFRPDQRLMPRYTPGAAFPLQVSLNLGSRLCRGALQNISRTGVGLLVGSGNGVTPDQSVKVQFVLDKQLLDVPARIAHLLPRDTWVYCGIGLNFDDFLLQKAYQQLLQPIVIGQSLQPVPADRVIQNELQFIKQVYRGEGNSELTARLAMTPGTPLHSVEFRLHNCVCRAVLETGVLEARTLESSDEHKDKLSNPLPDTSDGLHDEIRRFFRWIVPNLSKAVPDDIRALLQKFAASS